MSRRKADTHKGDFGHVFVLAGSLRYSGAGILCAEAALRSGAGLVTLAVPEGLARAIIKIKAKEVMLLPLPETKDGTFALNAYNKVKDFTDKADILVLGPGLGLNESTQKLARKAISGIKKTMVIDADGLNALVGHLDLMLGAKCLPDRQAGKAIGIKILTPHAGEMARLLRIKIGEVEKNRKEIAKKLSFDYNTTVVLKGKNTVVADYRGNLYLNKTGNPGMATAGSGDVLTGIIAGLLGQGLNAFEEAKYAVYLHGLAGDLAAKEKTQLGMIASDIIAKIPAAIKKCS